MDNELAVVAPSGMQKEVINYSDVESCNSKKYLLGDSTDRESDDDDLDVEQGVVIPTHAQPHHLLPTAVGNVDAPFSMMVGAPAIALSGAGPSTSASVDEFYYAAGKAPHPDVVIPKMKSRWWVNHELRKQNKAEERAEAAQELLKVQEEAF